MKPNSELAKKEMAIAERVLQQAAHEVKAGFYDAAISRSYYAIFHAARAALRQQGSEPKTHAGVVSEFGRLLIKDGLIEEEYSTILRAARDERQTVDYEVYELDNIPSKEDAEKMLKQAGRFIERMGDLVV
jgi:uncharacterized protein